MYIGNIVIENPDNQNIIDNKVGLFNIVNNLNGIIYEIPTLIIGWGFVKTMFSNLSILEKEINEKTRWTFTKKEKRVEFEKDIDIFYEICLNNIIKLYSYKYINVLTCKKSDIKDLLNKINNKKAFIFIKNDIFMYLNVDNVVYGIDLNMIDFINIRRDKIYKIIGKNRCELFFKEDLIPKNISKLIKNNIAIPIIYKLIKKNEQ